MAKGRPGPGQIALSLDPPELKRLAELLAHAEFRDGDALLLAYLGAKLEKLERKRPAYIRGTPTRGNTEAEAEREAFGDG